MKAICSFIGIGLSFILFCNIAFADFYVIPAGTRYKHPEVVSAYHTFPDRSTHTFFTVPNGKTFILTDFVSTQPVSCHVISGDTMIGNFTYSEVENFISIHLNSGMAFPQNTTVRVYSTGRTGVTISGYFIDN